MYEHDLFWMTTRAKRLIEKMKFTNLDIKLNGYVSD